MMVQHSRQSFAAIPSPASPSPGLLRTVVPVWCQSSQLPAFAAARDPIGNRLAGPAADVFWPGAERSVGLRAIPAASRALPAALAPLQRDKSGHNDILCAGRLSGGVTRQLG